MEHVSKTKLLPILTCPSKSSLNSETMGFKLKRAISTPNWKSILETKQLDYEMRISHSYPAERLLQSRPARNLQDQKDAQLHHLVVRALESLHRHVSTDISINSVPNLRKLDTLNELMTDSNIKHRRQQHHKHQLQMYKKKKYLINKIDSVDTPSLMGSELTTDVQMIKPEDEPPLYRMLNEAMGEIAGILSSNVMKKTLKSRRSSLTRRSSLNEEVPYFVEQTEKKLSEEADLTASQAHLIAKGMSVAVKALPRTIDSYLKRKCSLWKLKRSRRGSNSTSLSVNATSVHKEDSSEDLKVGMEDEDINDHLHPNNNLKLVKQLMKECTAENSTYRTLRKWMFPYRFSHKEFRDIHQAQVIKHRHMMQMLTGSDMIMLNRRTTMMRLYQFMFQKHLDEISRRQKVLRVSEDKRLRSLKIKGIISKNYDEMERAAVREKWRNVEKPHIAYNSLKPIFNENPLANTYKAVFKEIHRDIILKKVDSDKPDSIGQVSFLSDSSSLSKNFQEDDTLDSSKLTSNRTSLQKYTTTETKGIGHEFMTDIANRLNHFQNGTNFEFLFRTSEPLIYNNTEMNSSARQFQLPARKVSTNITLNAENTFDGLTLSNSQ